MTPHKRNRFLITLLIAIFLVAGTTGAVYFARGYRPNLKGGLIEGTGLLSATSYPKSAQVYIDGKLTSATDTTINLLPNDYTVKIIKEGFLPWEKHLKIQTELVTITDARLFPAVPSLTAVTFSGSLDPQISPDGKKIVYLVTGSASDDKNGLYVSDVNTMPIIGKSPLQIVKENPTYKLATGNLLWSPDGKQILLAFSDKNNLKNAYLLDANNLNQLTTTTDVTVRLNSILSTWELQIAQEEKASLKLLPDFLVNLATSSAIYNLYFSPDQEKIVYFASQAIDLPSQLKDQLVSINTTPQDRSLKPQNIYVYDLKEDTNYNLGQTTPNLPIKSYLEVTTATQSALLKNLSLKEVIDTFKAHYSALYTATPVWYQTSRHLITTKDNQITIFEYDNTNHSVVYSGPFTASFLAVSQSGDRLVILTNLNQNDSPENLYSLDLK